MYALSVPRRDHIADYNACIQHRRRLATRQLLQNATAIVDGAYQTYAQTAGDAALIHPAPRFTGRNTYPLVTPPLTVQASIATFTHAGTGTVRTRPCLPSRSTMHHRSSRC